MGLMRVIQREPDSHEPGQTPLNAAFALTSHRGFVVLALSLGAKSVTVPLDYRTAELLQLDLERALCEALTNDPDEAELSALGDDLTDEDVDHDDDEYPHSEDGQPC